MDWELIVPIILTILLLIAGGFIKKLSKEAKELFGAIQNAVEDGEVTPKELTNIIKEARDVKDAALSIAKLIARK